MKQQKTLDKLISLGGSQIRAELLLEKYPRDAIKRFIKRVEYNPTIRNKFFYLEACVMRRYRPMEKSANEEALC